MEADIKGLHRAALKQLELVERINNIKRDIDCPSNCIIIEDLRDDLKSLRDELIDVNQKIGGVKIQIKTVIECILPNGAVHTTTKEVPDHLKFDILKRCIS